MLWHLGLLTVDKFDVDFLASTPSRRNSRREKYCHFDVGAAALPDFTIFCFWNSVENWLLKLCSFRTISDEEVPNVVAMLDRASSFFNRFRCSSVLISHKQGFSLYCYIKHSTSEGFHTFFSISPSDTSIQIDHCSISFDDVRQPMIYGRLISDSFCRTILNCLRKFSYVSHYTMTEELKVR